ncbi:ABC transporter substrate-binding protein [Corynebacterium amycolatum]|uniref:ABC transporter substrate-binding protein n=1 Tax=Corynebacterium amycolatum TaxID=43765 RepID=UPI00191D325A|nr:ABC transporter substrate-binding protein [Corynebacterium amycolatum]QQU97852.1 ABC transporter substrate-binding protein [Corynebacterium amycolatum]
MFSPTSPISALKRNSKKAFALPLIAALPLAAVVACSSSEEASQQPSSSETSTNQQAQWPRTVTVGDHDVTVQSQPKRIVALSTEVADLALELVGPECVVAVTKNALDETSGNQVELARKVPNAIANSTKPDPEQILSYEPDMVLMTSRHDQEQSASKLLGASDVPTAAFSSSDFASPKALAESVTTLGKLLGAEDKAAEMVAKIESETEEILSGIDSTTKPKTLVLFARGGQKMIMGMQSATTNLVELAGGEPISPKGKRPGAVPADPETIVQLNPDVILIQDFHGQGKAPFQELLDNPALADVAAVKNDRVQLIDAKTTSGTAGMHMPDGLREIADALAK